MQRDGVVMWQKITKALGVSFVQPRYPATGDNKFICHRRDLVGNADLALGQCHDDRETESVV
jgi:hypothetical protein